MKVYRIYGLLLDGGEEQFRFEYVSKHDATKKAQELRNIISGVRYNRHNTSKYRDVVIREENVDKVAH